jgi:hypothetical protein
MLVTAVVPPSTSEEAGSGPEPREVPGHAGGDAERGAEAQ